MSDKGKIKILRLSLYPKGKIISYKRILYLVMTSLAGIFLSSWLRIHLEFGSPQVNKPSEELEFICTIPIIIESHCKPL